MKPHVPLATLITLLAGSGLGAQEEPSSYRGTGLFGRDESFDLTLTMDMRSVIRDIDSTKRIEHPARISYIDSAGQAIDLPVEVRTRGHFRRQRSNCNFPPLRLDFPGDSVTGTIFENQDKVKLVTHCQNGRDQYEQYLHLEYSAYKLLNVLTDRSFRARLVQMTYIDTEAREDTLSKTGILLESDEELAARLNGRIVEVEGVHPLTTEPEQMAIVDLFEFMVGNTDWSVYALHNIVLLEDQTTFVVYAIPYDFDWTGLVNARYAYPDERLGIRRVRDRLFRGFCRPQEEVEAAVARFQEKRDELYAVYDHIPGLEEKTKREAVKYLDEFFDTLDNPGKLRRDIIGRCRGG